MDSRNKTDTGLLDAFEKAVPYLAAIMPEEHREWWFRYWDTIELRHPETAQFFRRLFESWKIAAASLIEPIEDPAADAQRAKIQMNATGKDKE